MFSMPMQNLGAWASCSMEALMPAHEAGTTIIPLLRGGEVGLDKEGSRVSF